MFFLLLLFCLVNSAANLLEDRLINAEKWILRSHSRTNLDIGYGPTVVTEGICHIVETIGDFCGNSIAKEYDAIVLDIQILGSIAPVLVWTIWDPSTIKWLNTDVLQVDFEINITTAYDFNLGDYLVKNQTARLREYITFLPNSPLITIGYTVHDESANKMFALSDSILPNSILCSALIFPACNRSNGQGGNYLTDTGFSSIDECISFMNTLSEQNNLCPYRDRSNTTNCRGLHAIAAFLRPDIHCSHTNGYTSMTCKDSCMPACSNCHQNAKCVALHTGIPNNFTTVYKCQCKQGFVGNGTYCEPKLCSYNQCPALPGSYECLTDGLCRCTETFTDQPENFGKNNLCICSNGQIVTNNSLPVCVPIGKCINHAWECQVQIVIGQINQVQCKHYGVNTFDLFKDCVCNFGFSGGFEYPCVCDSNNRRILWSNRFNSELCLSNIECTDNYHCVYPQTCHISSGQQIGQCN
jgi:hypothetical protein